MKNRGERESLFVCKCLNKERERKKKILIFISCDDILIRCRKKVSGVGLISLALFSFGTGKANRTIITYRVPFHNIVLHTTTSIPKKL